MTYSDEELMNLYESGTSRAGMSPQESRSELFSDDELQDSYGEQAVKFVEEDDNVFDVIGPYKVPKKEPKKPPSREATFTGGIPTEILSDEQLSEMQESRSLPDKRSYSQALLRGAGEGLDNMISMLNYLPGMRFYIDYAEPELAEARQQRQMEGYEDPSFAEMLAPGYKPEGFEEKALEKGASFFTGSIPFGGMGPVRALTTGAGAEAGGELGEYSASKFPDYISPETGRFTGELLFGVGTDIGVSRLQPRFAPGGEQALQLAERQGVELPAAAVTESGSYGMNIKKNFQDWNKKVTKGMRSAFKDIVGDIEPVAAQKGREAAGRSTRDALTETYRETKQSISNQIDTLKNSVPGFRSPATNLLEHVTEMANNFSTAISPEGVNLANTAKNIRDKLVRKVKRFELNPDTNLLEEVVEEIPKDLSLKDLVDLKQQASDLYTQGNRQLTGSGRLKETFYEDVKKDLAPLKQYDEKAYNKLEKLYDSYRENNQSFVGKDAIRRVMNAQTGEEAVAAIKNPEEYEFMQKALLKNPNGKELLDMWNTAKVESIFRPATAKSVAGGFDHPEFLKIMNDPVTARWLDMVATPAMKKNLSELNQLSKHLEEGFNQLAKNKGGLSTSEYARAFATTGAITSMLMRGGKNLGSYLVGAAVPKLAGNYFGSSKFQKKVIDAAKNFKANRYKRGARLMSEAAQIMENSPLVGSEPAENE